MTLDFRESVLKNSETDVSGLSVEDAMAHYGVKGMKWGVRKDDYSKMTRGEKRQTKQDFKADAKWDKKYGSTKFKVEMYNDIAAQINARIGAINDKYKDKDIRDWSSGDGLEYVNEYKALAQRSAENSLKRMVPDSPSGKYTTRVELDPLKELFPRIYLVEKEVKHADDEPFEMEIGFIWKNNRIVKVKPIAMEDLAHSLFLEGYSEDDVLDILAHYGVKGMKWGVRNPVGPDGLVTKAASRISEANATRKANKEAKAGRTLVNTAKDMDLAELQKKVKRLELEKKYVSLSNDLNVMSETSWQKFRRETLDIQKKKVANDPGVARAVESVIRSAILSKVGAVK